MVRKCNNCGNELEDNVSFCTECGTEIETDIQIIKTKEWLIDLKEISIRNCF